MRFFFLSWLSSSVSPSVRKCSGALPVHLSLSQLLPQSSLSPTTCSLGRRQRSARVACMRLLHGTHSLTHTLSHSHTHICLKTFLFRDGETVLNLSWTTYLLSLNVIVSPTPIALVTNSRSSPLLSQGQEIHDVVTRWHPFIRLRPRYIYNISSP